MKDLKEMTPIELNVLINKAKENHEFVKANILKLIEEVKERENQINDYIENLKSIESKYVELMAVLMSKQN